jgi:hypothetical protein
MKRFYLILLLTVLVGANLAADVIWEIPYDFSVHTSAGACYAGNGWYIADDFQVPSGSDRIVTEVTMYVLDNGDETSIEFMLWDDGGSKPGNLVDIVPCAYALTDTGDTWNDSGLNVFRLDMVLDTPLTLTAGDIYWCSIDPVGGFMYWCGLDHDAAYLTNSKFTEDGAYSWVDAHVLFECDPLAQYFTIGASGAAIEETTWGQIKSVF